MFTSLHFAAGCMAAGTLLLIALRALALENNVEGEPVSLNDQVRRVDGQMRAAAMDLIETVEEMLP